jgi:hypothetical protein
MGCVVSLELGPVINRFASPLINCLRVDKRTNHLLCRDVKKKTSHLRRSLNQGCVQRSQLRVEAIKVQLHEWAGVLSEACRV